MAGRFTVAGDHIDAYREYHLLVGEADGGATLPQREYDALRKRAQQIMEAGKRLYVYWRADTTGDDCYCVGPSSRCFCGHSYSSHAWFETDSRRPHCRAPGCKCTCFDYIPGRGSQFIRCGCKHEHTDHRAKNGKMQRCSKPGCQCKKFHSEWRCGSCGQPWASHSTAFDTRADRVARGEDVENLAGGGSVVGAACGGVTRFGSLAPGCERGAAPQLRFTDSGVTGGGHPSIMGAAGPAAAAGVSEATRTLFAMDAAYDEAAGRRAGAAPQRPRVTGGHRLGSATSPVKAIAARSPGASAATSPQKRTARSGLTPGSRAGPRTAAPAATAAPATAAPATAAPTAAAPAATSKVRVARPGPLLGRRSKGPTRKEIREQAAAAAERRIAAQQEQQERGG
eukprot:TRINITY_DN43924_c0_g1_i1.p1 TRINITY_DN43924_c0_g1~~TRINITY_DN43924_c0_g1_i1.p1  ORF type:complete len:420 (+),score=94.61 TRINITY_DN43924_c0_g1_i1:72-1262(+)